MIVNENLCFKMVTKIAVVEELSMTCTNMGDFKILCRDLSKNNVIWDLLKQKTI
jgi:hypothetical protein